MENPIDIIIRERRSIYPHEYTGGKLSPEIIGHLTMNANYAPNHHGNYPWRFLLASGNALSALIRKAADIYKQDTPPEKMKPEKWQKILDYDGKISHIIAIVMKHDAEGKSLVNEDYWAVACAVENMWLTLSAYPHAGGYWSTGLGTYSPAMAAHLGLAADEHLMGFFVLGEVENKRTAGNRRDPAQFVREL